MIIYTAAAYIAWFALRGTQPEKRAEQAGKTVTRRYTDVWLKSARGWQNIARQATIISS